MDEKLCPICQQPNQCAGAAGKSYATCWCMGVTVRPKLLENLEGQGCICRACVEKHGGEV